MAVITDLSCAIPRPDIAELSEAVRAELSKRLLGGAPVLPLSSEDILSFVMAGTVNLMWGTVTQALKEQDPLFMCCDNLVLYGARRGINMLAATRAKGYVAITGDAGTPIPANIRFFGEASREYKLDLGVTFNPVSLNPQGGAVLRIVSLIPGSIFNLEAGRPLTLGTTVPGIDSDAIVVGSGLGGGTDDESCDELRKRIIASEANEIVSLNEQWYLQQTLRYPGVTRACTEACAGCCDMNDVTVYPFFEGVYGDMREQRVEPWGVPPCEVIEEATLWMFGREPGRGQGLAPLGIRGRFQAAKPATMRIEADCFQGCPTGAEDIIKEAMWNYLRYSFCVGSTMCKDQIRSEIYRALGPDPCMSNIQFLFDEGVRYSDASYIYLECGYFAIMGDVILNPWQPERVTTKVIPAPRKPAMANA